ncbi:hypothetical protein JKP88DRAFT_350797 [Tribonema minus]|uniref:Uncharacterized protein n=1 Tax=Tribonema minus TaxID=303371 RepID=A0A835YV73_9STRA|nr:hypothetical protein JKP88DRAFT_350797 [Tribonema minus]
MASSSTNRILQLEGSPQAAPTEWRDALSAFASEHSTSAGILQACGEAAKDKVVAAVLQAMQPQKRADAAALSLQAAALSAAKVLLREAQGSAPLMTMEASEVYLKAAQESRDADEGFAVATAGVSCLVNLLVHEAAAPKPVVAANMLVALPRASTAPRSAAAPEPVVVAKVLVALLGGARPAPLLHNSTAAPQPVVAAKVLVALLGGARPAPLLHLAARALYRLCATRAPAAAVVREGCAPVAELVHEGCAPVAGTGDCGKTLVILVSLLAWCVRCEDPPFPQGAGVAPLATEGAGMAPLATEGAGVASLATEGAGMAPLATEGAGVASLATEVLKLLYFLASTGAVDVERAQGAAREVITVLGQALLLRLGQVLAEALLLPHDRAEAYECKLHVVNLLMHMPATYALYLSENGILPSLVRITELQLLACEFEADTFDPAVGLAPILAVLAAAAGSAAEPRRILKALIFPAETDAQWEQYQRRPAAQDEAEAKAERERRMHPADAPPGSLRARLIACLTMVESTSRRFAGELLWALCEGSAGEDELLWALCEGSAGEDEFVYRVGFGSGVGLLRTRGLLGAIAGGSAPQ